MGQKILQNMAYGLFILIHLKTFLLMQWISSTFRLFPHAVFLSPTVLMISVWPAFLPVPCRNSHRRIPTKQKKGTTSVSWFDPMKWRTTFQPGLWVPGSWWFRCSAGFRDQKVTVFVFLNKMMFCFFKENHLKTLQMWDFNSDWGLVHILQHILHIFLRHFPDVYSSMLMIEEYFFGTGPVEVTISHPLVIV